MPPELKQKLKQVLAGRSSVDMGQFQFLNLDKVREGAGADWERLREKRGRGRARAPVASPRT